MLFRNLDGAEADTFRKWARDNYQTFEPIQGIWHPVVQLECVIMNAETGFTGVPSENRRQQAFDSIA